MNKRLLRTTTLTMAVIFLISVATAAFAAAPSYQSFRLSMSNGSVPISQSGQVFNAKTLLGTIPDATDKPVTDGSAIVWKRRADYSDVNFKKAALSMALGYCIFLQLTNLPADLKAAGADEATINNIVNGENVNQWFGTALQESFFNYAEHSGYYQIDNSPADIKQNSQNDPAYKFMTKLQGGAANNLKTPAGQDSFLNYMDIRGFVWESVEKGYYEAISYNRNKTGYDGYPTANFNFAKWAVDYANTTANATTYPPDCSTIRLTMSPATGFAQVMSLMYNRGQFPFVYPTYAPGNLLVPLMKDNGKIENYIAYAPVKKDADPGAWGKAYVWQLGWINTVLNNPDNTYYADKISAQDIKDMLNTLNGFYGTATRTASTLSFSDEAVAGALKKVDTMSWGAYNSQTTFDSVNALAKYLLANS